MSFAKETLVFSAPDEAFIQDISIAVLRQAYGSLGYEIRIKRLPNSRSLPTANRGEVDGEISRVAAVNNQFTKLVSIPVSINKVVVKGFATDFKIYISSWDDVGKYKLLCIRGVKIVEQEVLNRNLNCEYVTSIQQAVEMLHSDRGEVLLMPMLNGITALRDKKDNRAQVVSVPLIEQDLYHYVHIKNDHLVEPLTTVLESMSGNGEIERIRNNLLKQNGFETN